ncbi:MAG: hypothetical protein ACKPEQ_34770, partial [Dolichospermum sp.]
AWLGSTSDSNRDIFLYDGTTTTQITTSSGYYYPYNLTIFGNSVLSIQNNDLYITRPSTKPGLSINSVTVTEMLVIPFKKMPTQVQIQFDLVSPGVLPQTSKT